MKTKQYRWLFSLRQVEDAAWNTNQNSHTPKKSNKMWVFTRQPTTRNISAILPSAHESVRKMNYSGVSLTCFFINRAKLNKWSLLSLGIIVISPISSDGCAITQIAFIMLFSSLFHIQLFLCSHFLYWIYGDEHCALFFMIALVKNVAVMVPCHAMSDKYYSNIDRVSVMMNIALLVWLSGYSIPRDSE